MVRYVSRKGSQSPADCSGSDCSARSDRLPALRRAQQRRVDPAFTGVCLDLYPISGAVELLDCSVSGRRPDHAPVLSRRGPNVRWPPHHDQNILLFRCCRRLIGQRRRLIAHGGLRRRSRLSRSGGRRARCSFGGVRRAFALGSLRAGRRILAQSLQAGSRGPQAEPPPLRAERQMLLGESRVLGASALAELRWRIAEVRLAEVIVPALPFALATASLAIPIYSSFRAGLGSGQPQGYRPAARIWFRLQPRCRRVGRQSSRSRLQG